MCGIAGFFNKNRKNYHEDIKAMCATMEKRGPDAEGVWFENDASIVLGHRRLSILDLSDSGKQPMMSADKRYVISFNGEIYNFSEIKSELCEVHDISFRSTSDTEVLLEAFAHWGVDQTVAKIKGMYAIALYDRTKKELYLIRDRVGEKPLYYGWINDNFVFASTLNAISSWKNANFRIDKSALKLFFQCGYIPAPYSIYENIYKLEAGCYLSLRHSETSPKLHRYWDIVDVAKYGQHHLYDGSFEDAGKELERLVTTSIQRQLVADVPVGAFLSGGIDSTTVVALAQSISKTKLKTFTIGFENASYNEAVDAAQIARLLGTEHTEMYISDQDAREHIPELPSIYGEPFADSSQIPTYLVSKLARNHVTVSLSGDGGDELFCGYNTYDFVPGIYGRLRKIPYPLRKIGYELFKTPIFEKNSRIKTRKEILLAKSVTDMYRRLSPSGVIDALLPNIKAAVYERYDEYTDGTLSTSQDDLMLLDLLRYHPDDILAKVDRSAMAVSLESRVPFLDKDVVEFAWMLPLQFKKQDGVSKRILKEVLYRYVPASMMDRPKKGFAVPKSEWLRGPLKMWAEDMLSEERIKKQGILNAEAVKNIWLDFIISGAYADLVWYLIVFQVWMDKYENLILY